MSAYVVSSDTIDLLVAAAGRFGATFYAPLPLTTDAETLAAAPGDLSGNTFRMDGHTDQDLIGTILTAQNIRSVNARYNQNDIVPEYRYRSIPYSEVDPVAVLKSAACLRYQSCETDDYSQSFAAAVLETIERVAIHALPGYNDSAWGWTRDQRVAQ